MLDVYELFLYAEAPFYPSCFSGVYTDKHKWLYSLAQMYDAPSLYAVSISRAKNRFVYARGEYMTLRVAKRIAKDLGLNYRNMQ